MHECTLRIELNSSDVEPSRCHRQCDNYNRQPSILCCGGKNMEQSSVRSDVISDTVDV